MRNHILDLANRGPQRELLDDVMADIHLLLAHYMRALFVLSLAAFTAYSIFFSVMGVPYGVLLGAIAGMFEFIPLLGPVTSATIIILSTQAPSTQNVFVSLQNPEPQNGYPVVYSPTNGIDQAAAPEPATVLGWTTVIAALAVGHRFRRNQKPVTA